MNIFISYSWEDEKATDRLDNFFKDNKIELIRDKKELSYKSNIEEFMKKIRKSDFTILLISDSYLKSMACMYELLEFIKDDNYKDRILPIVNKNAKIFKSENRNEYIKYWKNQYEKKQLSTDGLRDEEKIDTAIELKHINKICIELGEILLFLSEIIIERYDNEITNKNFNTIFEYINNFEEKKRVNDLSSIFIKHDEKLEEIEKYKNLNEIQDSILSSTINYNIQLEKNDEYSLFIYALKVLKEENIHIKESQQFFYEIVKTEYGHCFIIYYQINNNDLQAYQSFVGLNHDLEILYITLEPAPTSFKFKQIKYIELLTINANNHEFKILYNDKSIKFEVSNGFISKSYSINEILEIVKYIEDANGGKIIDDEINNELKLLSKYYSKKNWFLLFDFKNDLNLYPNEATVEVHKKDLYIIIDCLSKFCEI